MPHMFTFKIGSWTAEFPHEYRVVSDGTAAVVLDEERNSLVLISLTDTENICIERTYYAMICEINAEHKRVIFRLTEEIG